MTEVEKLSIRVACWGCKWLAHLAWAWLATREARDPGARAYAFLNDLEGPPSAAVIEALRTYHVAPVLWTLRDQIRPELVA